MNRERHEPTDEDQKIDEAVEDSFPASDPPSNTPETGVRTRRTKSPPAHPDAPQSEEEKRQSQ